jgi:host factor-I protein
MQVEKNDLQNEFFNNARKDRATVNIFLSNGKKLVGRICSFDKFTVLLDGEYGEQIIYKHAISTVGIAHGGSGNRGRNQGRPPREQPTS